MEAFIKLIAELKKRIERLEKPRTVSQLVLPNGGILQVPKYVGDPASPEDGWIWYDDSIDKYKGQENGVIVIFTTTPA